MVSPTDGNGRFTSKYGEMTIPKVNYDLSELFVTNSSLNRPKKTLKSQLNSGILGLTA